MRANVYNRSLGQRRIRVVTAGLATLGVAGSIAVAGYTGLARTAVASTNPTQPNTSTSGGHKAKGSDDNHARTSATRSKSRSASRSTPRTTVSQAPANPPAATSGGS